MWNMADICVQGHVSNKKCMYSIPPGHTIDCIEFK